MSRTTPDGALSRPGPCRRAARTPQLFAAAVALAASSAPAPAVAQDVRDADTLPANVGGIIVQPAIGYGPGVERFGRGWGFGRESLIADFNELELWKVLVGDQSATYEALLGSLGMTNFKGSQTSIGINFAGAYGVTDRLTLAAFFPFLYASYTLEAWLTPNANQSTYGVRDPQTISCPGGQFRLDNPDDFNRILEERGPAYKFNIGDLRKALTSDCLDYKDPLDTLSVGSDGLIHAVGNRTYSGFRDLILGAKYKLYHGSTIQVSAITYLILPTGKVDDPRDLFDFNFGDGQVDYALLGAVTIPLGDFRVAGSAGYEISFGDTLDRRLSTITFSDPLEDQLARGELTEAELIDRHLDDASLIPVVTKYDLASVSRKLGDTVYVYSGAGYQVLEWLSVGVSLDFLHHFRDEITSIGPRFEDTPRYKTEAEIRAEVAAEVAAGMITTEEDRIATLRARLRDTDGRRRAAYAWHTVRGQLVAGVSVGINTLGPFLRDEFPLPILASISASRFLAGQNIDTPDSLTFSLIIPIPFGDVKDPAEYGFDDEEGRGLPWP